MRQIVNMMAEYATDHPRSQPRTFSALNVFTHYFDQDALDEQSHDSLSTHG